MLLGTTILPVREVRAQGSCESAIALPTEKDSVFVFTYSVMDSVYWFQFIGDTTSRFYFSLSQSHNDTTNLLKDYLVLGTNCSDLLTVFSDSFIYGESQQNFILGSELTQDSTYFLKITNPGLDSVGLILRFGRLTKQPLCFPLDTCNVLNNTSFLYNNIFNPNYHDPFGVGQISCWNKTHGTPQIGAGNVPNYPTGNYAKMWAANGKGEGIMQEVNIQQGLSYVFSFIAKLDINPLYFPADFIDRLEVRLFNLSDYTGVIPTGTDNHPFWIPSNNQIVLNYQNFDYSDWAIVHFCFTASDDFTHISIAPRRFVYNSEKAMLFILNPELFEITPPDVGTLTVAGVCSSLVQVGVSDPGCAPYGSEWQWWDVENEVYVASGSPAYVPVTGEYELHLVSQADVIENCNPINVSNNTVLVVPNSCYTTGDLVVPDGALSSSYGSSFPGTATVHILGQFFIDSDFNILSREVVLNPGAEIILGPKTFKIDDQSVLRGCECMWYRILMENVECNLIISNSIITDAEYAVHYRRNIGQFKAYNNTFDRNYISIYLDEYSGAGSMNVDITGNVFSCNDPTTGAQRNLLPPRADKRSRIGVYISNSSFAPQATTLVPVGNYNNQAASNTFKFMDYGIRVQNQRVAVFNNKFEDIKHAGSLSYDAAADIAAVGFLSTQSALFLNAIIGNSTPVPTGYSYHNRFTDCQQAIDIRSSTSGNLSFHTEVWYNLIDGMTEHGIEVRRGGNSGTATEINIGKNLIKNCAEYGVFLNNTTYSEAVISENAIEINTSLANTQGIRATHTTPQSAVLEIVENTLTDIQTGIRVVNYENTHIQENTITFEQASGSNAYGIRVTNCPGVFIEGNVVEGSSGANLDERGIQVESCEGFLAQSNQISACGYSMNIQGDNTGGNLVCNTFDDYDIGVGLEDVDVDLGPVTGDLSGSSNKPSDNEWDGNGAYDTYCYEGSAYIGTQGNNIDWYVRNTNSLPFVPQTNGDDGSFSTAISPSQISGTSDCNTSQRLAEPSGNEEAERLSAYLNRVVNGVVANGAAYNTQTGLRSYGKMAAAYRWLKANRQTLEAEQLLTSAHTALLSGLSATGIGRLYEADSLLEAGDLSAARAGLAQVQPLNTYETRLLTVNGIWAGYLELLYTLEESEGFVTPPLAASDSLDLLEIALANPMDWGNAVTRARVILGLDVDRTAEPERTAPGDFDENGNAARVLLFPNPGNGRLTLNYQAADEEIWQLTVFDLFGKKVYSHTWTGKTGLESLESGLENGVYLYQISHSGSPEIRGKLTIIR